VHECPDCGMVCDCDGEDTWNDSDVCIGHDCEEENDDYDDDYFEVEE